MTVTSDPIRNGAWSPFIKTTFMACLKGSWGTIRGKGSIPRGDFAAQKTPKFARRSRRRAVIAIVDGDRITNVIDDGHRGGESTIYQHMYDLN